MTHPTAALALIAGAKKRLRSIGAPASATNIAQVLGWSRAATYARIRAGARDSRLQDSRIRAAAAELRAEITCGADGWTVRLLSLEDT